MVVDDVDVGATNSNKLNARSAPPSWRRGQRPPVLRQFAIATRRHSILFTTQSIPHESIMSSGYGLTGGTPVCSF